MMQFSPTTLAIRQEIDHLFVKQPNSQAVLSLLGGFVQKKRYAPPYYSWEEHRKWVIENSNPVKFDGKFHRSVSTNCEHQVYVVNTTHQPTEMSERPYVGQSLYPLGDKDKKLQFLCGFICAGWMNNGTYQTMDRPEDIVGDRVLRRIEKSDETFGVKLYFRDAKRPLLTTAYGFNGIDIIITARVRMGEVIAFRVKVRTNPSSHRDGNDFDVTYRRYEKDFGDWNVKAHYPYDNFHSTSSHEEEMRHHNKMHRLIYELITSEGE